ncbi:MAG: 1-acyl-sn-glycerol-3-phosphate acyltransferase [Acidobacteria bacterium]|nr:1-acyl-sn-glycerol-3-phosphate acyltransferase [Acidobacteriota bacterium]
MLAFWTAASPLVALVGFPWTFITGNISLLYRIGMWSAITGVRLAGVRVQTIGLEKIEPSKTYIYMSNHVSNLDPPMLLPLIPGRTSVMAKKELFSYPILGKAMSLGALVPVDRGNRDAGIAAVREASTVLRTGISMSIFVEGKRSFDGKLLPFKKGPFYLAIENNVPVVPITIDGTHYVMPKRRFAIKAGTVKIIFHTPIQPKDFGSRDQLMMKVREVINSGLSPEYQEHRLAAAGPENTLPRESHG